MTTWKRVKRFFSDDPDAPPAPAPVPERPPAVEEPKLIRSKYGTLILQYPDGRVRYPEKEEYARKAHAETWRTIVAVNIDRAERGLPPLSHEDWLKKKPEREPWEIWVP